MDLYHEYCSLKVKPLDDGSSAGLLELYLLIVSKKEVNEEVASSS